MSSKESREASVSKDKQRSHRTPTASTTAREAEIAKLAEGLRAAEAAKKEREEHKMRAELQESVEEVGHRQRDSMRDMKDTLHKLNSESLARRLIKDPGPLALVMKNLERSLEHEKSLYGGGTKAQGKVDSKIGASEEVNLCDFEDAPGEASLATMLEKLEKNFQTQKAMYKESMALLDDRENSCPPPVRKKPAEELVDVVEDLMNFAAPVELNMPPLTDRPVREPEQNTPAGRAKEHMKSFWKVLKDSVETSALCVLQNLYANWQASFLEAVQETVNKTTRLAKNASQGSVTEKSGTRNSPRSTVPCSPGAADRLIDMINCHTQGVDRAIEGLLVRSGMSGGSPSEVYQNGHDAWQDAQAQAHMMHHQYGHSIFAEQRGRSMVTQMQSFDRSSSSDYQARLPAGHQNGQHNVLPYTIAHGQPIRSRSSAPGFFFEQTTISGQPRNHVYPPARGWNQGSPGSPLPGTRGIPRSPLLTGPSNCRSLTPSPSLLVPASPCSVPMPLTVRSPLS